MTFADDLFAEPRIPDGKNGGARPGAGRKKGTKITEAAKTDYEKYNAAKAEKEIWLAQKAEHDFKVMSGEYVPREDVRRASATAFAAISQTLRAIPDNLERRLGLAPEVAEEVSRLIDDAMGALAADLEAMNVKDYASE